MAARPHAPTAQFNLRARAATISERALLRRRSRRRRHGDRERRGQRRS